MSAITLPNVDRSTIEGLTTNLPSMREAGKAARGAGGKGAEALRRWRTQAMLRGQPRRQLRPWIASGVFMIALLGAIAALLTWSRRSGPQAHGETQGETDTMADHSDLERRLEDELP